MIFDVKSGKYDRFREKTGPKSVFEKKSRFFSRKNQDFFPRVAVAPIIMKFTQRMYIDVIKLF